MSSRVTALPSAGSRELKRRRREDLHRSLRNPHPESVEMAELGLNNWRAGLPEEDVSELLDPKAGKAVRWVHGKGWGEIRK